MEKFMQRQNVFLEYSPDSISQNSPKRSSEDNNMDFDDVFGGPPRRFSLQEVSVRYSFGEAVESEEEKASSPWVVLKEKPVFGEEVVARRRHHQGNDFYNDIFKADESYNSPRKTDHRDNLFGSNPSSRSMSPARLLPPEPEVYSTSLPAQLSLPSKLSKAAELPAFTPQNYKMSDRTSGLNSAHSPSASLSRFSNQVFQSQDEISTEIDRVYHQSPLSREASFSSEEDSPSKASSDVKGKIEKLKKETKIVDRNDNQFHFSIYKWAGRGVPMLMPIINRKALKSKSDISVIFNGRMEIDQTETKPSAAISKDPSENKELRSLKLESEKDSRIKEEPKEIQDPTKAVRDVLHIKSRRKEKDIFGLGVMKSENVISLDEIDRTKKIEKEILLTSKESHKSESKPLHSLLTDEVEERGEFKQNKTKTTKVTNKNPKKNEGMKNDSVSETDDKPISLSATKSSGVTSGKNAVKGKVREFIQIFSHQEVLKPKADVPARSESSRWKAAFIDEKESEANSNATKVEENVHNTDKKPDVSLKVDENAKEDETRRYSFAKSSRYNSGRFTTSQINVFSSESMRRVSRISMDLPDDSFEDNFLVEELPNDHENVAQNVEGSEEMKALDAEIQQWSYGKKGNIRSLLSTLQYVLWPGSGWTPVPLVDLIESNSVKRAYQKALLRLHPDKLQQKGAASSQKYIAEKVFDILQEAWDHFNSLAPL